MGVRTLSPTPGSAHAGEGGGGLVTNRRKKVTKGINGNLFDYLCFAQQKFDSLRPCFVIRWFAFFFLFRKMCNNFKQNRLLCVTQFRGIVYSEIKETHLGISSTNTYSLTSKPNLGKLSVGKISWYNYL